MTSERAQAYGRVKKTLEDLGPTKLQPAEQQRIRDAADALVFCEDVSADTSAQVALVAADEVIDHLIASERWTPERAEALRRDVAECGPAVRA